MGSLAGCLKRFGITGPEADYLRTLAKGYKNEGVAPKEANMRAVGDLIRDTEREIASIHTQLRTALPKKTAEAVFGPPPTPAPKPKPVPPPVPTKTPEAIASDAVADALRTAADKLQGKAPTPSVTPPSTPAAPVVPTARATKPLSIFDAAQTPRHLLSEEQSGELYARAEKAQADLEIASTERGGRYFTEENEQGSTASVTGLTSPTADWYKEATTGEKKLSLKRVEVALQKILDDQGKDVGSDVQRIKELLFHDQEFYRSPYNPQTPEDWDALLSVSERKPFEPSETPFALTPTEETKRRAAGPEQLGIPVPPETIGTRPIIGAEMNPEGTLWDKGAQEPGSEQTTLLTAEEPKTERESAAHEAYRRWFEAIAKRTEQEALGQEVLDHLEEIGRTPKDVVTEFWTATYPTLDPVVQKRFQNQIRGVTGLKPGDVISTTAEGVQKRAEDWQEIYPASEAPSSVEYLEGTERGLITLMELGNLRRPPIAGELTAQNRQANYDPLPAEAAEVQAGVEGKSFLDALDWVRTHAPSADYREIADRVFAAAKAMEGHGMQFDFHILHVGDRTPPKYGRSRGITIRKPYDARAEVYLSGADVTGVVGTSYETFLHEANHAVMLTALHVGRSSVGQGTRAGRLARDLDRLHTEISRQFRAKVRAGVDLTPFEVQIRSKLNNALQSPDEVLTWGLTNKGMQDFLESLPYHATNLWHGFVDTIRHFLGLPARAHTALSEALRISHELLNLPVHDYAGEAAALQYPMMTLTPITAPKTAEQLALFRQQALIAQQVNRQRELYGKPPIEPPATLSQPDALDWVVRKLQDKSIDLKRVVEYLNEAGVTIPSEINPVLKEEVYQSRAAQREKDAIVDELKPLLNRMRLMGVTNEELGRYLVARHVIADDINTKLKDMNPDIGGEEADRLSGMSNDEAATVLAGPKAESLNKLAMQVDTIVNKNRDLMVEYGLESQATIDRWRQTFSAYAPLKRVGFEDQGYTTGTGKSVRGSSVKHRLGSALSVDPALVLSNVMQERSQVISRGEKMRPVIALAALVMQHPQMFEGVAHLDKYAPVTVTDPHSGLTYTVPGDLATYSVPTVRKFVPASKADFMGSKYLTAEDVAAMTPAERIALNQEYRTWSREHGRVRSLPDPLYKGRDNVVNFRLEGKDYAIVFNERNPRAMEVSRGLKDLDTPQLNGLIKAIAPATRYLAAINTQYNPIFGLINFIRDAQFAMLTLSSTPLQGQQKKILSYAIASLKGIYTDARAVRNGEHPTSDTAKLWERFQHVGGPTGYRDLFFSTTDRAKEIQRLLNPKTWVGIRSPADFAHKMEDTALFSWLSDYNLAMENAMRLSVFKAGIESGMSDLEAASAAKNITVNFNKKGQIGAQMGAIYAFFNASTQGTARIAETLFQRAPAGSAVPFQLSPAGKKIVAGGILTGILQTFALAMAGFDEDEPPEYLKQKNLILPAPGTDKGYLMIPMPLGFNLLPNIGRLSAEALRAAWNGKPVAKYPFHLMSAAFGTLSPLGGTGSLTAELSPTVADPLIALEANKDWTGKPIAREDVSGLRPTPGHARARDTATVWATGLSHFINWATGGDQYTPGKLSPSPDSIDYLIAQATGGVGREVSKAAQVARSVTTGEMLPTYKIPLVGRFAGSASGPTAIRDDFYEHIKAVNIAAEGFKGRIKDHVDVAGYLQAHPEARLEHFSNTTQHQLKALQDQKARLLDRGASAEQVRLKEQQITSLMQRFNDRVTAVSAR